MLQALEQRTGQKPVLVAHDWGAVISWHTALDYPERMRGLVVMNGPHSSAMYDLPLPTFLKQIRKSWYIWWFQLPRWADAYFTSHVDEVMVRVFSSPLLFIADVYAVV